MKGFFSKFTGVANGILYGLQAILLTFISLVITVFKGIIALISIFITVVIVIALIAAISIVGIPLAVGGWLAIGIVVAATITLSLSLGGVFQNNTDIPGTEGFKNKEEKKNKLKKRWNKIKNFDFIKEYKKFYKMVSNHAVTLEPSCNISPTLISDIFIFSPLFNFNSVSFPKQA